MNPSALPDPASADPPPHRPAPARPVWAAEAGASGPPPPRDRDFAKGVQRRLTQLLRDHRAQLAAVVARAGVHPDTARRYLRTGRLSIEFAVAIALEMDVSLDWLLLGRGPPGKPAPKVPESPPMTVTVVSPGGAAQAPAGAG